MLKQSGAKTVPHRLTHEVQTQDNPMTTKREERSSRHRFMGLACLQSKQTSALLSI